MIKESEAKPAPPKSGGVDDIKDDGKGDGRWEATRKLVKQALPNLERKREEKCATNASEDDRKHEMYSNVKGDSVYIATERCRGASVYDIMEVLDSLNEAQIALVCRDMLSALVYLHTDEYIHRGIEASKIIINIHGHCKLVDFSVSFSKEIVDDRPNAVLGSYLLMAPGLYIAHSRSRAHVSACIHTQR